MTSAFSWQTRVHTAIFHMGDQQFPVEHRELCSMLLAAWMGGEFGGEWYMCVYD